MERSPSINRRTKVKLKHIFEAPIVVDKNLSLPPAERESFISKDALEREYTFLGRLQLDTNDFDFYLHQDLSNALVVLPDQTEPVTNLTKHKRIVDLKFKSSLTFKVNDSQHKYLQVALVSTNAAFRNSNLASALYIVLCRYGYAIVSDQTQFRGGKVLWKKLSLESEMRKYKIRILNGNTGEILKYESGSDVIYTGDNVSDTDIWSWATRLIGHGTI